MIRKTVSESIALAVEQGGDDQAAYEALKSADPLIRWLARRRIRRAVNLAVMMTDATGSGQDDRHLLRLAYLAIQSTAEQTEPDDTEAVERAYRAARKHAGPRKKSFWWVTCIAACLTLALVTLTAIVFYLMKKAAAQDGSPPPAGAYARGGRPLSGNPVLDRALGRDLPSYLVALDRFRRAKKRSSLGQKLAPYQEALDTTRTRILALDAIPALGAEAFIHLKALLDTAEESAVARDAKKAAKRLLKAVGGFNDELAARNLGYYLDGELLLKSDGQRLVIFYVYTVERVSLLRSGKRRFQALHLRRLDNLNWAHALLGFTRPEHKKALVLLDQVNDSLVTSFLPGLAGGRIPITGDEISTEDATGKWQVTVERRAASLVRSELAEAGSIDVKAVEHLGVLLARRKAMFKQWNKRLIRRGVTLRVPGALKMGKGYREALGSYVYPAELKELDELNGYMADPIVTKPYEGVLELFAASVERHEVQHRIDFDLKLLRGMPAGLKRYVGPLFKGVRKNKRAHRARAELSAYLAQLARDMKTTRISLTQIAELALDRGYWGTAASNAAMVILSGLAAGLGVKVEQPLTVELVINRPAVGSLYLALSHKTAAEIRRAARRLWEKLFKTRLPEMVKEAPRDAKPSRASLRPPVSQEKKRKQRGGQNQQDAGVRPSVPGG